MISAEYMKQGEDRLELPLEKFLKYKKDTTVNERSLLNIPEYFARMSWKLMWYRYHYYKLMEGTKDV